MSFVVFTWLSLISPSFKIAYFPGSCLLKFSKSAAVKLLIFRPASLNIGVAATIHSGFKNLIIKS